MSDLRRRLSRVISTVPGFAPTSLWEVLFQEQDLIELLERSRVFIYDACWEPGGVPFEPFEPQYRSRSPDVEWAGGLVHRQVGAARLSVHPAGTTPWFLGELSYVLARGLAHRGLPVDGLPVVGWCGWGEGGADFFGVDGTHIRAGQFDEARAFIKAWGERAGHPCSSRALRVGLEDRSEVDS